MGFHISAPGRICLFGEHLDYLGLSVIPAAITKRCVIQGELNSEGVIRLDDKIYKEIIQIPFTSRERKNGYTLKENDYLKAVLNVFIKSNLLRNKNPSLGFDGSLRNEVPQKSGLSSSAALLVSFTKLIDEMFQLHLDKIEIGTIAYKAEHDELGIPCGQMDQLAASFGNIFHMECVEPPIIKKIRSKIPGIVVGDTLIPKSTNNVHSVRVREINEAIEYLKSKTDFNIHSTNFEEVESILRNSNEIWLKRVRAALKNRDITKAAYQELQKNNPDIQYLGSLLTKHQDHLRDDYEVSVKKIEDMISAGMDAGALGGKLTGAGMGGSIILLAPGKQKQVAQALTKAGGKGYVVDIDKGVTAFSTY
jgi:galactokinase